MESNYDDIILLERYIEQSLSEEEVRRVEKRLAEEPALKELFQQENLLVKGIRYGHLKTKLEELKMLEATLPAVDRPEGQARVVSFKAYWKPLAAAAAVALFISSYLLLTRTTEPAELYAQNFKPYPNVFEPVVRGTREQNQRAEAFAAYERGDYALAAEDFNALLKIREEPEILLLLGNANLILGKTSEAKENFVTLSKDFDDLDGLAKWYLSLCYLKMGDRDSAKVLLEEIAGQESSYQQKARELLKRLD
jgi:FimV-like protein